jgi:hypothetical protein
VCQFLALAQLFHFVLALLVHAPDLGLKVLRTKATHMYFTIQFVPAPFQIGWHRYLFGKLLAFVPNGFESDRSGHVLEWENVPA